MYTHALTQRYLHWHIDINKIRKTTDMLQICFPALSVVLVIL